MVEPAGRPEADRTVLGYVRETKRIAVRVTITSFVFTVVVAYLLLIVQNELSSGSRSGKILGLPVDVTVITGSGQSLLMLVLALGGWVVVTSLSTLVVSRQVRNYLRTREPRQSDAIEAAEVDDEAESATPIMRERLLLEVYLSIASNVARVLAVTVALALSLPVAAVPGLALGWVAAALIGRHRFRVAATHQAALLAADERWRLEASLDTHVGLVDAIYRREAFQRRLTLPQSIVLVSVVLGGVLAPAWLVGGATGTVALVLCMMWLQGLMHVSTEAAPFGWRWTHRFDDGTAPRPTRRRKQPASATNHPERHSAASQKSVRLHTAPPAAWPHRSVVWLRPTGADETLVMMPARDGTLGGVAVSALSGVCWQRGVGILVLQGPLDSGGFSGLGDDSTAAARTLWDLVDPSRSVVVVDPSTHDAARTLESETEVRRHVVVGGDPPAEGAWLADSTILLEPTHATAVLSAWFDPTVTDQAVSALVARLDVERRPTDSSGAQFDPAAS